MNFAISTIWLVISKTKFSGLPKDFPLFLILFLLSHPDTCAGQKVKTDPSRYFIQAVRIQSELKIDGKLNELDWSLAQPGSNFTQLEPEQGMPASESTEVLILYDGNNLYLGIKCFDSQPEKIVANVMCRDADLSKNDMVGILLDTFHDHRNAFCFVFNPLGAKQDGLITDEGKGKNFDWDGVWECATSCDSSGWNGELAIPFRSLRFQKKENQTWGFNVSRIIRRRNEFVFWTPISRDYGMDPWAKISMMGHLKGLENLKQKRNLHFKPYVLAEIKRESEQRKTEFSPQAGLDLKYGVSSNLTLDLTLNTDFAQVEADQYQVNLNRFDLFFPEKRDFFLEGAGIFHFGERIPPYGGPPGTILFFSRKIGLAEGEALPILGGFKLTGKSGKTNLGLLNMYVNEKEVEDEDETYVVPRSNFTVIRLERDILEKSSLGLIFLNKQTEITSAQKQKVNQQPLTYFAEDYESVFNRVVGADANFSFFKNLNLGGFVAKSHSPEVKEDDWAGGIYTEWMNDLFGFDLSFADIQDNFTSEMGFILREDVKKSKINLSYSPRPKLRLIRQSFFFFDNEYYTDQANAMVTRNNLIGVFNELDNGGHLLIGFHKGFEWLKPGDDFDIREDKWVEVGAYKGHGAFMELGTDQSRMLAFSLHLNGGDFFNGKLVSLNLNSTFTPSRKLSVSSFFNFNKITELPVYNSAEDKNEIIDFETQIIGSRITYSFSPRMFFRGFLQWNSDDEEFSANLLVNYIYKLGSDFYVVYNELWERGSGIRIKDRIFLIKIAHLLNL